MKKQYIAPTLTQVNIATPSVICTSITGFSLNNEETTNSNYVRRECGVFYDDYFEN